MQTDRLVELAPTLDLTVQQIEDRLELQRRQIERNIKALFYAQQAKKMVEDLKLFIPPAYFGNNWEIFEIFLEEPDLTPIIRMMRYRAFFEALKMVGSVASRIISSYDPTAEKINLVLMNIMVDVQTFPTYFKVLTVNHPCSALQVSHFNFFVDKSYLTAVIADAKRFNTISSVSKSANRFIEEIDKKITATVCFMNNIRNETIDEAAFLETFDEDADGLAMNMGKIREHMEEVRNQRHPTLRKELAIIYLKNIASVASCHIATLNLLNADATQSLRELSLKTDTPEGILNFNNAMMNVINIINHETGWLDIDALCGIFAIYFKQAGNQEYIATAIADVQETHEDALKFIHRFDDSQMLCQEFYSQQQRFSGHISLLRDNQSVKLRLSRNEVYQASMEVQWSTSHANVPTGSIIPPISAEVAQPDGDVYSMSAAQIAELNYDLESSNQDLIAANDLETRKKEYEDNLQKTQNLILGVTRLHKKFDDNFKQLEGYGIPPRKKFQKVITLINEVPKQIEELSVEDKPYSVENAAKVNATLVSGLSLFDKLLAGIDKISEEFEYLSKETVSRQNAEVNKAKKEQRALAVRLREAEEAERLRLKEEEDEKREAEEERLEAVEVARQEELEQKRLADIERAKQEKLEKQRLDKLEQQRLEQLRLDQLENQRLAELENVRLAKIEQARLAKKLRREESNRKFMEIKAKRKADKIAVERRIAEEKRKLEEEDKARKIAETRARAQEVLDRNAKLAEIEKERQAAAEVSKMNLAALAELQVQAEQTRMAAEAVRLAEEVKLKIEQDHKQLTEDLERGRLLLESVRIAIAHTSAINVSPLTSPPVPIDHTELTRAQSAPQTLTLKHLPIGVFTPGHSHTPSHSHAASPFTFFNGLWQDNVSPLQRLLGDEGSRNPSPTGSDQASSQEDIIIQAGYRSPAPGMRPQYE